MTHETLHLLARRHLNRTSLGDFVDWAVFLLEEGYDTEHLRMLASLGPAPASADIAYYFSQTIWELRWIVPSLPILLRLYAQDIAQRILDGKVLAVDGCHEIYGISRAMNYPEDMKSWLYLDDGLEPETYIELKGENWDLAIRQEAWRFLQNTRL